MQFMEKGYSGGSLLYISAKLECMGEADNLVSRSNILRGGTWSIRLVEHLPLKYL